MKKNPPKWLKKIRPHLTRRNLFTGFIVLLFLIMFLQVQSLFGTFDLLSGQDSSLIEEVGQVKDAYIKVGQNLNDVRKFLGMPTSDYGSLEKKADDEDQNKDQLELALFQYLDSLVSGKQFEEKLQFNKSLLTDLGKSETFADLLKEKTISLMPLADDGKGFSLQILGADKQRLVLFYLAKDDGSLTFKTFNEKKQKTYESYESFEEWLTKFLQKNTEKLLAAGEQLQQHKTEIEEAIKAPETQKTLLELGLKLNTTFKETDLQYTYFIDSKYAELIGKIVLKTDNREIWLVDAKDSSATIQVTDVKSALPPFLKKLDHKSIVQKKAADTLENLKKSINDKGFQLLLKEGGMSMSAEPREDKQRYYFDLYEGEKHVSSIVLEKATGVVNIVNPDGTSAENLLFFDPEFKKKTLEIPDTVPDYGDTVGKEEGVLNILVTGKQGMNVDTMILAHLDENKHSIAMVSIPRDLLYNGRKINALAYYYGMPELKKAISKISGYHVDKYILIDMYAFIDVVDLIGGVDINLKSPLVDPSYKVVNNGVASTLHYDAGDHHLGGVEALRVARSRKTTSDFSRAERQQQILKAIQEKAKNFGFGDADTIYQIIKTILAKTETDIGLDEAVAYFFRYQNYEIDSMAVIHSANVLYVPPYITTENCQALIAEAASSGKEKPDCEGQNHAYTLLPKNNNWNLVKWFFKQQFEEV